MRCYRHSSFKTSKSFEQFEIKISSPVSSDLELKKKMSGSMRSVCRIAKALRAGTTDMAAQMDLIIWAGILEHENAELCATLMKKKGCLKGRKAMGLFANDEPEQAVFFSPAKIAVIQVRQEEFEAQKE